MASAHQRADVEAWRKVQLRNHIKSSEVSTLFTFTFVLSNLATADTIRHLQAIENE